MSILLMIEGKRI